MDKQTEHNITKGMILEMIASRIREGYSTEKDMFLYISEQIRKLEYDENPTKEPRFIIISAETGETINTAEDFVIAEHLCDFNKHYIMDTEKMTCYYNSQYEE